MKPRAICLLSLLVACAVLGLVMACQALAEEPAPSRGGDRGDARDLIVVPPVIVKHGLTVESCAEDIVVMTAPIEDCRYVAHTKRINKQTKRVTVTVRCVNDPTENTP